MKKYRIVQANPNKFVVQRKFLCFWVAIAVAKLTLGGAEEQLSHIMSADKYRIENRKFVKKVVYQAEQGE